MDMNQELTQEFTVEEVEISLIQLAPLKSPGLDDMLPLFYQNYWSLVGSDVIETILSYLNLGTFPDLLCHSFITLIPKVKKFGIYLSISPYLSQQCIIQNFLKSVGKQIEKNPTTNSL